MRAFLGVVGVAALLAGVVGCGGGERAQAPADSASPKAAEGEKRFGRIVGVNEFDGAALDGAPVGHAPLAESPKSDPPRAAAAAPGSMPPVVTSEAVMPELSDFAERTDQGRVPGQGGDNYAHIVENRFMRAVASPLSTFSIDVDTAAYSKTRMYLMEQGQLPPPDAVRLEEMLNYFDYDYAEPKDAHPFAANVEIASCPWKPAHRLVRVGIQGKKLATDERKNSNLVFLVDVSGSMDQPNKLPLVQQGLRLLTSQLTEKDRVAMVTYAAATAEVLPPTSGEDKRTIVAAIDQLRPGGSTAGGAGIVLAYEAAKRAFIVGGVNRVILCTDGDFNVGVTSTGELVRLVEKEAKSGVFLTVLGFGMGNHNDAMLEEISNKGDGNYAFIDNELEARKVLVEQLGGTLETIAKDVKIQIEFNPGLVAAYRQIGYENRQLAAEDFKDDTKDAGEIGAGHRVTALYEIVPAGVATDVELPEVDPLKYGKIDLTEAAKSGELLTVKLRYKQPDGAVSTEMALPVKDDGKKFAEASGEFKFAAAVAGVGMLLRGSKHKGDATFDGMREIAEANKGPDAFGLRAEFVELTKRASRLTR